MNNTKSLIQNNALIFLFFFTYLLSACQRSVSVTSYNKLESRNNNKYSKIIMDNTMTLTPTEATIDSITLVYSIMDAIIKNSQKVEIIVYFNGAGPKDYTDADAAGYTLKKLLISHGYPAPKIDNNVKFYTPKSGQKNTRIKRLILS